MNTADLLFQNDDFEIAEGGAKAFHLNVLTKTGYPVPPWFCVSVSTHRSFLEALQPDIDAALNAGDFTSQDSVQRASDFLRTLIEGHPLATVAQEAIQKALSDFDEDCLFSVRSSSLMEDSMLSSSAGMLDTYLFLRKEEILTHVKACWASHYSPRMLTYCQTLGVNLANAGMGVVVQKMVDAAASGVMFTQDPMDGKSVTLVSGYGLGEGIVSARVPADTFRYERSTGNIQAELVTKSTKLAFDQVTGSGIREEDVPVADWVRPSVTNDQIRQLVSMGIDLEAHYGFPQDVEWAIDKQACIYLLQTRPITTLAPQASSSDTALEFDNSNIVESFPGIVAPLTFSILSELCKHNMINTLEIAGISSATIRKHYFIFDHMVAYIKGHVYYNLSHWHKMFSLLPGLERLFISSFDNIIGAQKGDNKSGTGGAQFRPALFWAIARFLAAMTRNVLLLDRYIEQYIAESAKIQNKYLALNTRSLSNLELAQNFDALCRDFYAGNARPLINDFLAMLYLQITQKLFKRFRIEGADEIINGLLSNAEVESAKPLKSVLALAAKIKRNTALESSIRNFLSASPPQERDAFIQLFRLQIGGLDSNFVDAFMTHLALFGHRCVEELKLESETYQETPTKLLAHVMEYANVEIDALPADGSVDFNSAMQALEQQCGPRGWWRVKALLKAVGLTKRTMANRERTRIDRGRYFALIRKFSLELGKRFAESGITEQTGDIFYLRRHEIVSAIMQAGVDSDIRTVICRRKQELSLCKNNELPEKFRMTASFRLVPVSDPTPAVFESLQQDKTQHVLTGTACSRGYCTGRALVVDDPRAVNPSKDHILVAKNTDPGWIFLMTRASGLVSERGSLLSHTAVIGRELGIPTVVGVKSATTVIENGAWISVDGTNGRVVIHASNPLSEAVV